MHPEQPFGSHQKPLLSSELTFTFRSVATPAGNLVETWMPEVEYAVAVHYPAPWGPVQALLTASAGTHPAFQQACRTITCLLYQSLNRHGYITPVLCMSVARHRYAQW